MRYSTRCRRAQRASAWLKTSLQITAAEEEEQEEAASPPTQRVEGERLLSFASVVSESDDPFFFLPSTRHLLFLFIGFICFGFVWLLRRRTRLCAAITAATRTASYYCAALFEQPIATATATADSQPAAQCDRFRRIPRMATHRPPITLTSSHAAAAATSTATDALATTPPLPPPPPQRILPSPPLPNLACSRLLRKRQLPQSTLPSRPGASQWPSDGSLIVGSSSIALMAMKAMAMRQKHTLLSRFSQPCRPP